MKKQAIILILFGIFLFIQPLSVQAWTEAKRLTWTAGSSIFPAIAADSANSIHMVWEESKGGNNEI